MRNTVDGLSDKPKKNVAIFASGTGSNAESIIKYSLENIACSYNVVLIVSNLHTAKVHDIASKYGIRSITLNDKEFEQQSNYGYQLLNVLKDNKIDFIALAGYLRKIPSEVVEVYPNRILNIHPSLLPKFGGKGMFGINVHRAVLEAGEKESGITIHFVNNEYDKGIILKQCSICLEQNETPESLAIKILRLEHLEYPLVLDKVIQEYLCP